jgi:hypothetical protein
MKFSAQVIHKKLSTEREFREKRLTEVTLYVIIISNLSDDRSTASSKTIPPLNAI